jgi:hypothetical protein
MKAFIEKIFKSKKIKKEQEDVAKEIKKENHVDCECKECIAKVKQNAK